MDYDTLRVLNDVRLAAPAQRNGASPNAPVRGEVAERMAAYMERRAEYVEHLQAIRKEPAQLEVRQNALQAMKSCLRLGYGFVLAGNTYKSFVYPSSESSEDNPSVTGVIPAVNENELDDPLDEHCVFVAGYLERTDNPNQGYLICKNSLGMSWGDRGYYYLPFEYVLTPGCVLEAWTAA